MTIDDARDMCMKDSKLKLSSNDANLVVCWCRMTVSQEALKEEDFQKVQFVELLEMVARIGDVMFKDEKEKSPL